MISIIIPFYNEKENLPILIKNLIKVATSLKKEYEIILVDDGSTDDWKKSFNIKSENVKTFSHRKRKGKGRALLTGINNSKGEIIVFMDADLQDDPVDLPRFIKKIEGGYDFVNGIRKDRQDVGVVKMYSSLASGFLRKFLKSPFTDINCGYKVFRREVLTDFSFYGNNFRFFPLTVFYNGFKVTEIEVKNHKRKYGKSKFGPNKIFIGIFDTITAYFLYRFSEKPLHFFGTIGGFSFIVGLIITSYLTYERIFYHVMLYRRPMLLFGILLIIVGIQIGMTGIIGELIVFLHKKLSK